MKKYKPHPELESAAQKDAHETSFIRGAIWYERQIAPDVAELVSALSELNAIVRSNFGIVHPEAERLLKKYGK